MYITYQVYRDDYTDIKHHGKPITKIHNLCFACAVKAIICDEIVESKITENEYFCEDCSL